MNNLSKIPYLLLGFILLTISCKSLKKEKTTQETTSFISQDKLGNIYQISDMKIIKYSSELDTIISNSVFSNGTISSLDTRNPLQLMLFFQQQQEIVLLDNTLSETNKISLTFFEWIDLACLSNRDNAFWLYSKTSQSLIKTNIQGKVISRFKNIGQLVKRDIDPTQLIEHDNSVYLFDSNQGLFVFDLYGNYIKRIELKNAEKIKFYQKKVFFLVENSVFSYNLVSFDKKIEFQYQGFFWDNEDFEIRKKDILLMKNGKIEKAN